MPGSDAVNKLATFKFFIKPRLVKQAAFLFSKPIHLTKQDRHANLVIVNLTLI